MKIQDRVYWPLAAFFIGIQLTAPYIYNGGNPWANKLYSIGMFSIIAWCTLRYRWNDWQPSLDLMKAGQDAEGHHILTCRFESRMEKWDEMVADVCSWLFTLAVVGMLTMFNLMLWAVLFLVLFLIVKPFWPRLRPWYVWLRARARYACERIYKWYCNVRQK